MKKQNSLILKIPPWLWTILSVALAVVLWLVLSASPTISIIIAPPEKVIASIISRIQDGSLWVHFYRSLFRVVCGFGLGFIAALPVAFLMGWYPVIRNLVAPWLHFFRNIPALAFIPLVVIAAGVGEESKILVIFICVFMTMVITVYQGVRDVDLTLINAARVLGTSEGGIFFKVVIPYSIPFILVGARLGLSVSLTTLIAAELTGTSVGLGVMIQKAQGYYDMATVLAGVLIIGIIGILLERLVSLLERRLTKWQETQQR